MKKANDRPGKIFIVNCFSKSDVQRAVEKLKTNLDNENDVKRLNNPRIKNCGVESDMNLNEILTDINDRNIPDFNTKCTGIFAFQNKENTMDMLVEVSLQIYCAIKTNPSKVFVVYQRCRAYDDLNVSVCLRCGGFNHSPKFHK